MRGFLNVQWLMLGATSLMLFTACAKPVATSPDLAPCLSRQDRFIRYDNQTLLDQCTQQMWMTQDFRQIEGQAPRRWHAALAWADKMNQQRFAGYADWRPATIEEYQAIYQPPSSKRSYRGNPVGYPTAFDDGGGEWYWVEEAAEWGSSSHIHQAYFFNFRTGKRSSKWVHTEIHQQPIHSTGSIRLVRGPVSIATR